MTMTDLWWHLGYNAEVWCYALLVLVPLGIGVEALIRRLSRRRRR